MNQKGVRANPCRKQQQQYHHHHHQYHLNKNDSKSKSNGNNAIKNSPHYDFSPKTFLVDCFRRLNIYYVACAVHMVLTVRSAGTRHLSATAYSSLIVDLRVRLQILRNIHICPIRNVHSTHIQWQQYAHCIKTIFHSTLSHISVHNVFPFSSLIHVCMYVHVCQWQSQYAFIVTIFRERNIG